MNSDQWWRNAVVYQVYLRSFADADGDGIGDIKGLRKRLDYIAQLGVDAIWLNPCYPSPQRDHGYDIADYTDIDLAYGTMADFDALIVDAHRRDVKVIMDMVANHCSSEHPWFQAALTATPHSVARERFLFRDGGGPHGQHPPNDWQSVFGGPAWTRIHDSDGRPGQWYLHLFDPTQPDFNWRNPEVQAMFENALRFWFDRGVDGFRLDVAHGLVKHPDLANWPPPASGVLPYNDHMWNQPEVHDIYRSWRALADSYPGTAPKVLIGEVWVPDDAELARYVRSDELHQVFYFQLLGQRWDAGNFRSAISAGLQTCAGQPTWTMANHDVHRTVTRLGTATHGEVDTGSDLLAAARLRGEVDVTLGERRARASLLLILALPGSVYLYQGEELGLPEVLNFPEGTRQDPMWTRSNGKEPGRDGCRVPLPWQPIGTSYGFSPPDAALPPWLPQPDWFSSYAVSEQLQQRNSFLSLNQEALILRRAIWHTTSPLTWLETGTPNVIAFSRGAAICAVNFGLNAYRLPAQWGPVVLLSREGDQEYLQANSGAWIVVSGRRCN